VREKLGERREERCRRRTSLIFLLVGWPLWRLRLTARLVSRSLRGIPIVCGRIHIISESYPVFSVHTWETACQTMGEYVR
jgi:hypothetical protein